MHPAGLQAEQQQQGAQADAGLVRQLLAAAMHSRAAYGYAMQVSFCPLQALIIPAINQATLYLHAPAVAAAMSSSCGVMQAGHLTSVMNFALLHTVHSFRWGSPCRTCLHAFHLASPLVSIRGKAIALRSGPWLSWARSRFAPSSFALRSAAAAAAAQL